MIFIPIDENRCKILVIPKHYLLSLFMNHNYNPDYISIPKVELPNDAYVTNVHYDPCRLSFLFFIESESFLPTPDGMYIPEMYFEWQSVKYVTIEGSEHDK